MEINVIKNGQLEEIEENTHLLVIAEDGFNAIGALILSYELDRSMVLKKINRCNQEKKIKTVNLKRTQNVVISMVPKYFFRDLRLPLDEVENLTFRLIEFFILNEEKIKYENILIFFELCSIELNYLVRLIKDVVNSFFKELKINSCVQKISIFVS